MNNSIPYPVQRVLLAFWLFSLIVVSGFLVAEYRFFKTQAEQLSEVRNEYVGRFEELKKRMLEPKIGSVSLPRVGSNESALSSHVQVVQASAHEEPKKQPRTDRLLLVNRAMKHLNASPESFTRVHKFEKALKKKDSVPRKPKKQLVKKNAKKRVRTRVLEPQWKKVKRESIFTSPLEKSTFWLSSPYGPRKNPDGSWRFHTGIDMAASRGTPVLAAGAGVVLEATYSSGYGNTIVIEHDRKFKTRYAHLDKMYVRVGQKVRKGEYIARVGATGFVRKSRRGGDGSHLHFEVYVFGKHANPFYYLA